MIDTKVVTKPDNTTCPVADFDEREYLDKNPDVSAAVSNGVFRSGWQHFLLYGHAEDRAGTPANIDPVIEQVLTDPRQSPIPPDSLRDRVHGAKDTSGFIRMGKTIAFEIYMTFDKRGFDSQAAHRILDFGCGCGRVLTWLSYLYPNSVIHATDIDVEAIEWCRNHLGQLARFNVNRADPPLAFDNEQFDLVYSISIFTHLPETMQFAWLEELSRVCRPGALLLLTVHGDRFFRDLSSRGRKQLARHGFYYVNHGGTRGLPDFYQHSFHTEEYVRREWSRYLDVLEIRREGMAGNQDLVICRKRAGARQFAKS